MADDIQTPAGSGADPMVATDDVGGRHFQQIKPNFGPDGVTPTPVEDAVGKRFPVKSVETGAPNIFAAQVAVTSSSNELVPARATRRRVWLIHEGVGEDVRYGQVGVGLTGGFLAAIAGMLSPPISTTAAVHGRTATATGATISYVEEYD